ncbi:hypothetical protein B0T26DRAFT_643757 [Lasiosphaeria miniovina]|uniref:Uncharacterized protein n=1 Tax=Lasiosphaeria miniovina TaxID=1954250 RepID=A0AA40E2B8_9PEZI|nr:uncharacterized protein B0T26DRAFT_643757 [Lasiosphaeria miniovina]KAK0721656.1 hypothetical protein B0T26DRAFT_643757 [Lasiosphaeria miniovina]
MSDQRTPLLHDRQGLPLPIGSSQVQDHPIFLRVCHSPWPWLNQSTLVYLRSAILSYLTVVGWMLIDYKIYKREDAHTAWRILFQFSTLAYVLLWFYHLVAFSWSFTHLYYPDIQDGDQRWESRILRKMSPPIQTLHSRKRLYFSLFYTFVHVVVFMNAIIYWTVLVPAEHGHFPKKDEAADESVEDFFGDGWFKPFCIINLWGVIALLGFVEILILNSVKRPVPVPTHIFTIMFFLSGYLGWAAFGKILTDHYPYFWMDPEAMEKTEIVAAYSSAFVGLGATVVFAFIYGLIGIRENLTKRDEQPAQFNAVQFSVAVDGGEEFQRANGQQQQR